MRYRTHVVAAAGTLLAAASVLPHTSLAADGLPLAAGTERHGEGAENASAPARDTAAQPPAAGAPAAADGAVVLTGPEPPAGARALGPAPDSGGPAPGTRHGLRSPGRTDDGPHRDAAAPRDRGAGRHRLVRGGAAAREGSVTAADLLARTTRCDQVSDGMFRTDDGADEDVPVCGTKGAVFWKADLDIDCDGRVTAHCNSATDDEFQNMTAFPQSDGRPLDAEKLPYVVVPDPDDTWDYRDAGVHGGGVAAVVHDGRVEYAVVGDTGPAGMIGEASYATAAALGITPDPSGGGAPRDVTYILFKDTEVSPVESHAEAVRLGQQAARAFADGDR